LPSIANEAYKEVGSASCSDSKVTGSKKKRGEYNMISGTDSSAVRKFKDMNLKESTLRDWHNY